MAMMNMPPQGPPMSPPLNIEPGPGMQKRPILNRNRGADMKGHGREGNIGGPSIGPDFRPAGFESTGRQPLR